MRSFTLCKSKIANGGTEHLVAAVVVAFTTWVAATQAAASSSDDALPLATTRSVHFSTDEGTWLDLDLSPDGKTILFEMLGDLYTLPIAGGKARRMTSGAAYDSQPRFSPDGSRIVFISDRNGGDNIWIANADGIDPRPVTQGTTNLFRSLEWSPDGYVVASKNQPSEYPGHSPFPWRGYPAFGYQITFYDLRGGTGYTLNLQDVGVAMAPAFGSDPRYFYASVIRSGSMDWSLVKFDREAGTTLDLGIEGRAVHPIVSPNNEWLIYGARYEHGAGLRLRDLKMGNERWLSTDVQRDAGFLAASRGQMPGAAFTPDSRSLVTYNKGKIWRIDVATGNATEIKFTVDVDIPVAPLARFEYRVPDDDLVVAQIRGARPSPNGKYLAFTALNRLWIMDLPNGRPRRLTSDTNVGEHQPTWSPDGRFIAYVGWHEGAPGQTGGSLRRVVAGYSASPTKSEALTTDGAYYEHPVYSPDGSRILANRESLSVRLARAANNFRFDLENLSNTSELVWIPSKGGKSTRITSPATGVPMFTQDSSRIWINSRTQLDSLQWDGTGRRTVIHVPAAADLFISPRGTHLLALAPRDGDIQAYLLAMPPVFGLTVNLAYPETAPIPTRKATTLGASFPGWAADGRSFHYSLGRSFFTVDTADQRTTRTDVTLKVPADKPQGTIALLGARIVTSGPAETIEKGDVVVRGNRIAAVGRHGDVAIPSDAHLIDVNGKTIVPGYIDTHGHLYDHAGVVNRDAILHNVHWPYLASLAYGVTTNRDPGGSVDEFSYADMVATGEMLGPRLFSVGPQITALFNIERYEDALRLVKTYGELFGTRYIKQYGSGERQVRQWLIMAAALERVTADVEPYFDPKKSLADAMDGYAELAHSIPLSPVYKDIVQLLAQTGISYTATLMTMSPSSDSKATGALHFYTREDLLGDRKLRRFVPVTKIYQVALHNEWYAEAEYGFAQYAADVRKMIDAGVNVGIGSHGDFKGPGFQWEMEMHAAGGVRPGDILRAATIGGAKAIGLARDIGSIEPGKLADLQILDLNPADDIRNARSIVYVMKNGRLYLGDTLDEVWPRQVRLPPLWWN